MLDDLKDTLEKLTEEVINQTESLVKNGKSKYDEFVRVKAEMVEREAQLKKEKAEAEAQAAREKEEEALRAEQELLEREKTRLMALSEKELMVEMILTLRGYNTRICEIKRAQDSFAEEIEAINAEQDSIREDLETLEKLVDKDKPFSFSSHPDD